MTTPTACSLDLVTITRAELLRIIAERDTALRLAYTDPLTGLANRAGIDAHLATRTGTWCAAVLDLDHFKPVNDTLGHDAGDIVLRNTAARLVATTGPAGFAARLGGDEFVLLLPGTAAGAVEQLHRVAAAVGGPHAQLPMCVSTSIGVADHTPGLPWPVLLSRADQALYTAKADRGSVVAWTPDLPAPASWSARRQARDGQPAPAAVTA